MPKNDDPLLTVDEVSARLNVPKGTLYRWRHYDSDGPKSIKVGSGVRYRESAVEAYLQQQEKTTARGGA
ncbi:MAG: helix-turn-helix domain-containing protein [Saccharothrix sp.]|nr:helix-turn-helix domain-containing protein [Saccharothrix sp.]